MKEVYENSSEVIEYKVELLFTGFFSYFEAPFFFFFFSLVGVLMVLFFFFFERRFELVG